MEFRTIGRDGYHENMFEWLLNHFRNRHSNDFLCPVYLQHHGHSRCVVGVDERSRQILLFDPSWTPKTMRDLKHKNSETVITKLSHSVESFDEEQYQLVVVQGLMVDEHEFEVNCSQMVFFLVRLTQMSLLLHTISRI